MLPIYNQDPSDWKDLQNKVAKIFADMRFTTEVEKDIDLVRGDANVDVYAVKEYPSMKEVHIAECKHWSTPVSKHVVHSVRTILADYGANTGYIISREGFQSGAYTAAANSNLHLFTFLEFQREFQERWLDAVVDELEELGEPLRKYCDGMEDFYDKPLQQLPVEQQNQFHKLRNTYWDVSLKSFRPHYKHLMSGKLHLDYMDDVIRSNSENFPSNLKVECMMDYFDYLKHVCKIGVQEFDDIFGAPLRKGTY